MGGMIAQSFAIRHPARTRTLISIMSTTGDPDVGQPDPEVAGVLLESPADGREAVIEASVAVDRVIASPMYFDVELSRAKSAAAYDREYYPDGILRQLLAILTQRPRSEDLRALDVPALVIHGAKDPLVTPTGGQRTHEVLRGSELIVLPEAGHDMPEVYRPELIDRVTALAMRNVPA
jgi:pimeloyl-ACP methyl ester carboxylesterase